MMAAKRKIGATKVEEEEPVDPSDQLRFLCLGGGNEVGRSCHIIQYKGKTVMLDAGMHPAYDGLQALPFFDEFDLSEVDILLISHFHIDHAAGLPYVLAKTNFKGRVFMTHSTKAIYKWLIQDSVRVGNTSSSAEQSVQLYTEADHLSTFPQIEAIDYYTTHTVSSIRFTPYPAGHVLGAAMFLIEIAGLRVLFTGDYSRELDRHLIPAQVPQGVKIDVLITESTFGISTHTPRAEREAALMKSITSTLNRGGRVLMPVFALGRAQELLLLLDEYWQNYPDYRQYPIYYASALARKCMAVYQTYIGSMNDNIKRIFRERMAEAEAAGKDPTTSGAGPWDFKYIRSLKSLERFEDIGGCVMLASPGMLQSGVSRELLERWAPDPKNGVIITGYSIEGTMARMIIQEPDEIQAIMTSKGTAGGPGRRGAGTDGDQIMIKRRCSVAEYSFAAHVDGQGNREFIEEINAPVVILVHGERRNMTHLKSKLLSLNASKPVGQKTKVYNPLNCEDVFIPIRKDKTAKIVGTLAERIKLPQSLRSTNANGTAGESNDEDEQASKKLAQRSAESEIIRNAVLVQNDLKLSLMAVEDLHEYAGLTVTTITCRQKLTLASAGLELILWALRSTFGGITEITSASAKANGTESNGHSNGLSNEEDTDENGTESSGMTLKKSDSDEDMKFTAASDIRKFRIMDTVTLEYRPGGEMEIEWEGSMMSDAIADSVIATLSSLEANPAAVKQSTTSHSHSHSHEEQPETKPNGESKGDIFDEPNHLAKLFWYLESAFGEAAIEPFATAKDDAGGGEMTAGLKIRAAQYSVTLHLDDLRVEVTDGGAGAVPLRERVRAILEKAVESIAPLWAGTESHGVRMIEA